MLRTLIVAMMLSGVACDFEDSAPSPAPAPSSDPPKKAGTESEALVEIPVVVMGSKMVLNPRDEALTPWLKKGIWEPLETKLFEGELEAGDIVVDVGANIGYYTLLAAKIVGPSGKVYAFEPDPEAYDFLVRNIEINGYENVVPIRKALGDEPGELELFKSDKNRGDHRIYDPGDGRTAVKVDVTTLDVALADVTGIDLIKIDTQGAECSILAGGSKVLAREQDAGIIMEYTPKYIRALNQDPEKCLRRLHSQGFSFFEILEFAEKKAVVRAPLDGILERYPVDSERYTNLFLPSREKVRRTPTQANP